MGTTEANAALLESWELDLRSPIRAGAKPKRPRTIRLYVEEAQRFAAWLVEHHRPTDAVGDLEAVQRVDVGAWIADLRAQGLSQSTVRSRWIALRNLYGWAHAEDVLPANPMANVNVPRADIPDANVLSDDSIKALLKACQGTTFYDRRDMALIRFMIATGLRVSEVCAVEVGDIDLLTRLVVVTDGKGGKARVSRFDPTTASAIDRYKRARGRHRYAGRPELWLGHRGPLSRKGIPPVLEKRAALAGIGHLHPHMTRHTWAHRLKAGGAADENMMRLGGWSDASSMRRYGSQLATERALAAYDEHSPLNGL